MTVGASPDKFRFVTREESDRIVENCPDAEWRLIFALTRFGGLRCPSELLALTWEDVDWSNKRLHVDSPKTEHHDGKASRVIPLFPEVETALQGVFDVADPGTVHVINRYRNSAQNLRTQFTRIIRRAGLEPWPKPFQNLRSTRETELAEEYPLHVVTAWIGNGEPVAANHYLQITSEHFDKAVQNPVQYAHATRGNGPYADSRTKANPPADGVLPGVTAACLADKLPRRDSNPN